MSPGVDGLAVLFKLHPAPRKLAESRAILRHLQARFGRINSFFEARHAQNAHNYIFAIFANPSSYDKAIITSPITIDVDVEKGVALKSESGTDPKAPFDRKQFKCEIQPSKFDHAGSILKNPFNGPYDVQAGNLSFQAINSGPRMGRPPHLSLADFQLKQRDPIFANRKAQLLSQGSIGRQGLMGLWRKATGQET